jgi:uncharacterized cofD-like protein
MALAALCGDDEWGATWSRVVQHRFRASGDLQDHTVGNVLIVALWELLEDPVAGLDWVGRLLGARGRVLPMASVPLDIAAQVSGLDPDDPTAVRTVRGQVAVATTLGRVENVSLVPPDPPACVEALQAVGEAEWVVFGPGSWFTSVMPHLLVPNLVEALCASSASRMVALNLAPQQGETTGFSPERYLEVMAEHAPDLRLDVVLADPGAVPDPAALQKIASSLGAELVLADVAQGDGSPRHDIDRLASAYADVFRRGRIGACPP